MKRNQFCSIINYSDDFVPPEYNPCPERHNNLYDLVYMVDPITLLPANDEAVFLSDKTSPEIKDFILQNLRSTVEIPKSSFPDVPEDDLIALTRNSGESRYDYAQRVYKHLTTIGESYRATVAQSRSEVQK